MTAAQAKVQAIADLTHSAYQKASTLQLTKEESDALQADFPDDAFFTGAAGKENLIYIAHPHLRERLTKVFGMGGWALITRSRWDVPFKTEKGVDGTNVYVEAMLVIRGCFVAEAIGDMAYYPKNQQTNYGDAVEGAESAALRRCCKKFGIGLQAWKKDWIEGWWQRRRDPKQPMGATPRAKPKEAAPAPKLPTEATRAWMIAQLNIGPGQPARKLATEYFEKISALIPGEQVEDLPLQFVPFSKQELEALASCLANFEAGGDAVRAFEPHYETKESKPVQKQDKPIEVPRVKAEESQSGDVNEWFMDIVVPVPRKGQKRDEYMKDPDTIRSLYDARHDDEDARKRLWGFVNHYEPKGWEKKDGTKMPPGDADIKFREALDAFNDWFEKEHPDESL